MILETTQLLNNALVKHDPLYIPVYRPTHQSHPASIWAGESIDNFKWLNQLGLELCQEYTFRYIKRHKCQDLLEAFSSSNSRNKLPNIGQTPFKLCMPEMYHAKNPIESYRLYYRNEKFYFAKWKKREEPSWWKVTPIMNSSSNSFPAL